MDILDIIDWINFIAEALLGAVFALLCFRQAGKREDTRLFFLLLAGFFSCVCMSDFFFVLTWIIEDYPFILSPGDLSWVGGFLFLITATMSAMDGWTREQKGDARKYKFPALAAPAVFVAVNVILICIYPQAAVNYILYAIPMAILSYLSLWLFFAGKKAGARTGLLRYHRIVLI